MSNQKYKEDLMEVLGLVCKLKASMPRIATKAHTNIDAEHYQSLQRAADGVRLVYDNLVALDKRSE